MNQQADGKAWAQVAKWCQRARIYAKRAKHRHERRKARRNPECQPTYSKFDGWVT